MNHWTLLGIALLGITWRDYANDKTNTVFIFEWWAWFDVSKSSRPGLYWLIILAQIVGGVFLIIYGIGKG